MTSAANTSKVFPMNILAALRNIALNEGREQKLLLLQMER
jgi:hypothetical protein